MVKLFVKDCNVFVSFRLYMVQFNFAFTNYYTVPKDKMLIDVLNQPNGRASLIVGSRLITHSPHPDWHSTNIHPWPWITASPPYTLVNMLSLRRTLFASQWTSSSKSASNPTANHLWVTAFDCRSNLLICFHSQYIIQKSPTPFALSRFCDGQIYWL